MAKEEEVEGEEVVFLSYAAVKAILYTFFKVASNLHFLVSLFRLRKRSNMISLAGSACSRNRRLKRAHSLYCFHCLYTCSLSDLDYNTFNLLAT